MSSFGAPFRRGETVTIIRAARITDSYSQSEILLDWDNAAETRIAGCAVYPAGSGDTVTVDVGRRQVTDQMTVLMPADTDVTDQDRLRIRGHEYDVTDIPHNWHHPMTGWNPGIQLQATRREG